MVTAHPDDVDFGAAGTVATLTDAGVEVAYCIVTDGDAGGSDRPMSRTDMAAIRREEQRAARPRRWECPTDLPRVPTGASPPTSTCVGTSPGSSASSAPTG